MKNFHEAFSPANVKATLQAHGEPAMNSKIPRFKIGFASSGESRTNVPSGILDTNGAWVRYEDHVAAFEAHVPQAWTNLLAYVLQDDLHNRTTPRIIDIAYTAFMAAKAVNKENGGPSDWFNDTKPVVMEAIAALRNDLIEELPSVLPVTTTPAVAAPMVPGMPPTDNQRPYDGSEPDGYMESNNEWIDRNLLAVRWLIENHAAIRSALAAAATRQGGAYAALPDIDEDNGLIWQAIFDWKDCERGAPALAAADRLSRLLADQMRAFADATCELRASHGQAPAYEAGWKDGYKQGAWSATAPTAKAADNVPAPPPPPECETEAEKRAFAFGWFKALESERMKAESVQEDAALLDWLIQETAP